jgi:hypothetical protein
MAAPAEKVSKEWGTGRVELAAENVQVTPR